MKKISTILSLALITLFFASCHYQPVITHVEIAMVQVAPQKGKAFYIGKYEVTQKQWRAVMGTKPAGNQSGDNFPIENVSYDEIQEFITKLNEMTKTTYRLPTESEWETAAYAANRQFYVYAGCSIDSLDNYAWYKSNSLDVHGEAQTHEVGTKKPNGLGIYDLCGNVSEVIDAFSVTGDSIYTKGGSSRSLAAACAVTEHSYIPTYGGVRGTFCGFRLARD